MLLVIDIGNTQIAAGIYVGQELRAHWRLSSNRERTEDEIWILMQAIASAQGHDITRMDGVAISSVVPDMTAQFEKMITRYTHCTPVVVSSALDLGFGIRVPIPTQIGADRLCDVAGGIVKYGAPLIIVDFGTATTFDVISPDCHYLGGLIAPGIETSAAILHQRTAQLPRVNLRFPASAIGDTTETNIQSGLMFGTVAMIDGMVERISGELGQPVNTVATGGLARVILSELKHVHQLDEHLTLDGLRILYERNRQA